MRASGGKSKSKIKSKKSKGECVLTFDFKVLTWYSRYPSSAPQAAGAKAAAVRDSEKGMKMQELGFGFRRCLKAHQ